jgi:hypothetical protein
LREWRALKVVLRRRWDGDGRLRRSIVLLLLLVLLLGLRCPRLLGLLLL